MCNCDCFNCIHSDCINENPAPENLDKIIGLKDENPRKLYYREWQRTHARKRTPEQVEYWKKYQREYAKKYYQKHRIEIIQRNIEYQKKNYPEIKKRRAAKCAKTSQIASAARTQIA